MDIAPSYNHFRPRFSTKMHQCQGLVPLRCKVFAILNNCANGDEADVSFVQTQKTQSL